MNHSLLQNFTSFILKYQNQQELIEQLYLKVILDSYARIKQIAKIEELSENEIRNKFIADLFHNNTIFRQYHKTIKLNSENQIITENDTLFRTDIEFFVSVYGTFVIECKKLKWAEKRYIADDEGKGGIERFTNLDYAPDEKEAGMIGFIVKGKPVNITNNLKKKIQLFKPAPNMPLLVKQKCIAWEFSFQSQHIRDDKTEIHLYHLFFDFVKL